MQEKNDGTFGDIMDGESLLKKMFDEKMMEQTKALHFGTEAELKELKDKGSVYKRLDELEEKLEDMKPVKTSLLIPTEAQINKYAKKFKA